MSRHPVLERLARGQPLVLDGDTAHELARRGYQPSGALGNAAAAREVPALLGEVHRAFVDAGADMLLAFTARTTVRALARGGFGMRAAALTNRAVDLAVDAAQASARPVAVAGVLGSIEDAQEPAAALTARQLADEHAEQATRLSIAGCDAIVVAPMPTLRETLAATAAARRVTESVFTVLAAPPGGVADAAPAQLVVAAGALSVLLESDAAGELTGALDALGSAGLGIVLGARLALDADEPGGERYAGELLACARHGAHVLGGGAGAGADEIRALVRAVRRRAAAA